MARGRRRSTRALLESSIVPGNDLVEVPLRRDPIVEQRVRLAFAAVMELQWPALFEGTHL